jgi:inner membrane protein
VSWNIIHIFDPFIFSLHVLGILLWTIGAAPPEVIFSTIYILLAAYYVWRTIVHRSWQQRIASLDREHASGDQYTIIPTISLNAWNVVKRQADGGFQVGDLKNGRLRWVEQVYCDDHPAVEASKQDPAVSAFLYFTSFACAEMKRHSWGYEVRWVDVRYRHRKQYPFVAVVYMDLRYRPLNSYVGWLSDNRIQKKLRIHAG